METPLEPLIQTRWVEGLRQEYNLDGTTTKNLFVEFTGTYIHIQDMNGMWELFNVITEQTYIYIQDTNHR